MVERNTSWTLIHAAARGDERARDDFARRYLPAVRDYLTARWRANSLASEIDDAAQEVFVDCLRSGGVLERSDPARPFGTYLLGVARTVALRFEERRAREHGRRENAAELEHVIDTEASLSQVFDRAWAAQVMREAAELQGSRGRDQGGVQARRVELLRLRFQQGLSIREIAEQWGEDPARVHHEYAAAREDFRTALHDVLATRHGYSVANVDAEGARLLEMLG